MIFTRPCQYAIRALVHFVSLEKVLDYLKRVKLTDMAEALARKQRQLDVISSHDMSYWF